MPDIERIKKIIDNLIPVWLTVAGPREIVIGIGLHMFDLGHRAGIIETITRNDKMGEIIDESDLEQGDRILFRIVGSNIGPQETTEGRVAEVSPSRKWVLIELAFEHDMRWYDARVVRVVEKLEPE